MWLTLEIIVPNTGGYLLSCRFRLRRNMCWVCCGAFVQIYSLAARPQTSTMVRISLLVRIYRKVSNIPYSVASPPRLIRNGPKRDSAKAAAMFVTRFLQEAFLDINMEGVAALIREMNTPARTYISKKLRCVSEQIGAYFIQISPAGRAFKTWEN